MLIKSTYMLSGGRGVERVDTPHVIVKQWSVSGIRFRTVTRHETRRLRMSEMEASGIRFRTEMRHETRRLHMNGAHFLSDVRMN